MPKVKNEHGLVVKLKEIDEITFCLIKRKFFEIFSQNKMPTIMNLHEEVRKDENLPNYSFKTILKIVKHLHLKFTSRKIKIELIERHRIALWSILYLKKIQKFREERKFFYYIDEVVLTEGTTLPPNDNCENSANTKNKPKQLIACHIGSEEGFLDDGLLVLDSKKEMTCDIFEDWFKKILPKLKENSVLILNSADCHSRRVVEAPDEFTLKSKVCSWLDSHNISYDKDEPKVCLLLLVEKERHKYVKFVFNALAAERGITVLRTPPYYNRLNPMQTILYEIRNCFKNKIYDIEETKKLLSEKLNEISLERWKELIDIAVKEEEWINKLYYLIDDVTDDNIECMSSGDEEEDDEFDKEYQDFVDVLSDN